MTMKIRFFPKLLLSLSLIAYTQGCGDDSSGGGGDDAGETAGGGGSSSSTGGIGSGTGGDTTPTAIASDPQVDGKCGDNVCNAPNQGLPCCTVTGAGEAGDLEYVGRGPGLCGADIGMLAPSLSNLIGVCLQLDQPGVESGECPEINNGFATEPGCCTDLGFCGTMNMTIPLGCVYPNAGPGAACDPAGSDADGGTGDADAGL